MSHCETLSLCSVNTFEVFHNKVTEFSQKTFKTQRSFKRTIHYFTNFFEDFISKPGKKANNFVMNSEV